MSLVFATAFNIFVVPFFTEPDDFRVILCSEQSKRSSIYFTVVGCLNVYGQTQANRCFHLPFFPHKSLFRANFLGGEMKGKWTNSALMSHRRCGFMRRRRRFVHFRSINRNLHTILLVFFYFKRVGNPLKIVPSLIMHINTPW